MLTSSQNSVLQSEIRRFKKQYLLFGLVLLGFSLIPSALLYMMIAENSFDNDSVLVGILTGVLTYPAMFLCFYRFFGPTKGFEEKFEANLLLLKARPPILPPETFSNFDSWNQTLDGVGQIKIENGHLNVKPTFGKTKKCDLRTTRAYFQSSNFQSGDVILWIYNQNLERVLELSLRPSRKNEDFLDRENTPRVQSPRRTKDWLGALPKLIAS